MVTVLPNLKGLGVQPSGALVGVGVVLCPHRLDVLAAVGVQEEYHGVVLDVVQPLHCSGRDVQQGVLVLQQTGSTQLVFTETDSSTGRKSSCSYDYV